MAALSASVSRLVFSITSAIDPPAESKLGASIGAAQSFKEFGDMTGPLLVGLLTQFFGVRVGFVACGAVALVLLGILSRSSGMKPVNEK